MIILAILAPSVMLCQACVNSVLFYPTDTVYATPAEQRLSFEQVTFESKDGTRLTGWFVPSRDTAKGTVLHFHGNAQNMTAHFSYVAWLPDRGFNVFVFDYRGYGRSEGTPGRDGVYQDCLAAIQYVQSRPDVDGNSLLVLGQSFGGANAVSVLGTESIQGIKAIAIESSFYSYRVAARDKIRQIPLLSLFRWPLSFVAVSNRHSPSKAIGNLSPIPLLLIHGTHDQVIPYRHAQMLFEKANNPKLLITIKNGRHTDALVRYGDRYRNLLVSFYERALYGE